MQGLGNKVEKLEVVLEERTPDILLLSEHWQCIDQIQFINLENYSLCCRFCRDKNKHGGVAIYTKNNIRSTTLLQFQKQSVANIIEC